MTEPRRSPGPNPRPRAALGRVRPLSSDDALPGRTDDTLTEPALDLDPERLVTDAPAAHRGDETSGRDVLIRSTRGRSDPLSGRTSRAGPMLVPPVTDLMPRPKPAKRKKHGDAKAKSKAADAQPTVDLVVPLAKGLRKRLKAKAEEMGSTPESAVARLVEVWVDG